MVRKSWSFKEDRRLLELAKSEKTLEQIAKALDRSPDSVHGKRQGTRRLNQIGTCNEEEGVRCPLAGVSGKAEWPRVNSPVEVGAAARLQPAITRQTASYHPRVIVRAQSSRLGHWRTVLICHREVTT